MGAQNAGIIIIGEEILNGSVTDLNAPFFCKQLHVLGIRAEKVSVIPDDVDVISKEIVDFSRSFDIVLTTGGVGPTHDDVTYEAVSKAFNLPLQKSDILEKFYHSYLDELNNPISTKLIMIPATSEVLLAQLDISLIMGFNHFPIVKTNNVFCFPGVPHYVKPIFFSLSRVHFRNSSVTHFSRDVYLKVDEIHVAEVLNNLSLQYEGCVTIGSYPLLDRRELKSAEAKICFSSTNLCSCLEAEQTFLNLISPKLLTFPDSKLPDFQFIDHFFSVKTHLSGAIATTLEILSDSFDQYHESEMFLSFNGGKDCTVLLNIVYYCFIKNKKNFPLKLVYFKDEDSFDEVNEFIQFVNDNYNVKIFTLAVPIKSSLEEFVNDKPSVKACLLGIRNTDPNADNLRSMQETDTGWPKLMRISPILHWSFKDVWDFIRAANLPYCSLYNQGYTSLGSKSRSAANPVLMYVDPDDKVSYYKPAYLLNGNSPERHGRDS